MRLVVLWPSPVQGLCKPVANMSAMDAQKRYQLFRLSWGLLSVYVCTTAGRLLTDAYFNLPASGIPDTATQLTIISGALGSALLSVVGPSTTTRVLASIVCALLLFGFPPSCLMVTVLALLAWVVQRELGVEAASIPISGCCLGALVAVPIFWTFLRWITLAFLFFQAVRCFPWLVCHWPPLPKCDLLAAPDEPEEPKDAVVIPQPAAATSPEIHDEWEFDH